MRHHEQARRSTTCSSCGVPLSKTTLHRIRQRFLSEGADPDWLKRWMPRCGACLRCKRHDTRKDTLL